MAEKNSKDLLKLEVNPKTISSMSCLESKLFVCKKDNPFSLSGAPLKKPSMSHFPKSHVHDFLGIISESNKKLLQDAKDNPDNYDIEVLNGKESEYIEMDLMLGVADLHTLEAVAAAESEMAGRPPLTHLAGSEDSSDENDDDVDKEDKNSKPNFEARPQSTTCESKDKKRDSSSKKSRKQKPKQCSKIVELS